MRAERWREAEALMSLLAARGILKVLPFRRLVRVLERPVRARALEGAERDRARREVRRAIHLAQARLPGTACLAKAIAAQAMLRRRGVPTTLYFGLASRPGPATHTHAWLQDGSVGSVGYRLSRGYRPVASYTTGGGR